MRTPTREELATIHAAIEAAQQPGREGPFGLFDYSGYGDRTPHHVRDFRLDTYRTNPDKYGACMFHSTDPDEALTEYNRLTAEHIAMAAFNAVVDVLALD